MRRSFFTEADARRFALQNTCSKQFCGKLLGRSASALKRDLHFRCFQKLLESSPPKLEQLAKIQIYYINFLCRCQNFQMAVPFFYFNEKFYSKRYIKIHGPQPSRPHTFLHKINTSAVKIRPVFKKFIILIS